MMDVCAVDILDCVLRVKFSLAVQPVESYMLGHPTISCKISTSCKEMKMLKLKQKCKGPRTPIFVEKKNPSAC
jgi:hypothetical protein